MIAVRLNARVALLKDARARGDEPTARALLIGLITYTVAIVAAVTAVMVIRLVRRG
jgi:hypothetical protein